MIKAYFGCFSAEINGKLPVRLLDDVPQISLHSDEALLSVLLLMSLCHPEQRCRWGRLAPYGSHP